MHQILLFSESKQPEGLLPFKNLQMRAIIAILNYFHACYLWTNLLFEKLSFPEGDLFVMYNEI